MSPGVSSSYVAPRGSLHGANIGQRRAREWCAILVLLFGGLIFGVGWIVGAVLLWSSQAWTTREKWVGTLVLPGGLALMPVVAILTSTSQSCVAGRAGTHCVGGTGTGATILEVAALVASVVLPSLTALYLSRRLRWQGQAGRV